MQSKIVELKQRLERLQKDITQYKIDLSDFAHSKGVYILNPYYRAGSQVAICNFHCHTTNSDGSLDPTTMLKKYQSIGYSLVGIADHWTITEVDNPALLNMQNCESSRDIRTEHWLMINIPKQAQITEKEWQQIITMSQGGDLLANYAKLCRKLGILSALAHPRWLNEDYWKAKYDFFEICNGGYSSKYNHEWMLAKVLSNSTNRCFLIANDDNHATPTSSSWMCYTRVLYSGAKTVDNILTALKNGQCYPTIGNNAPIMNISIQGKTVTVTTNKTADIDIICGETVLSTVRGKKITYDVPDNKPYIRIKAYSDKSSPYSNVSFSQILWCI